MNFKDIYKSANDNICADRKIIDKIYEKSKKNNFFDAFDLRQFSLCAAALVLIIALSAMTNVYNNSSDSDTRKSVAVKDKQSIPLVKDAKDTKTAENNLENEKIKNNDTTVAKTQIKDTEKPSKAEIAGDSEKSREGTAVIPRVISEDATDDTHHTGVQTKDAKDTAAVARNYSGGGSGASSGSGSVEDECIELSIGEYEKYLGIDIDIFEASLPKGMKFDIPSSVSVVAKDNKYVYDDAQFTAIDTNSPQKTISVSVTRLGGDAKTVLETASSGKTLINNHMCVINKDGPFKEAYFKHNGVWVSIFSVNITDLEFESFINSLLNS